MHILSPETDNCPSWISGRERMTVENISWSISTKECCRPRRGLNPRPPGLQSDGASNWATEAGPKRGNLNTKRTAKYKNKMTHSKTYNKSPRRINHKATKSKTNTGTTGKIVGVSVSWKWDRLLTYWLALVLYNKTIVDCWVIGHTVTSISEYQY